MGAKFGDFDLKCLFCEKLTVPFVFQEKCQNYRRKLAKSPKIVTVTLIPGANLTAF
jgi:hypothetical protein